MSDDNDQQIIRAAHRAFVFLTDFHADNQRDVVEDLREALTPYWTDTHYELKDEFKC